MLSFCKFVLRGCTRVSVHQIFFHTLVPVLSPISTFSRWWWWWCTSKKLFFSMGKRYSLIVLPKQQNYIFPCSVSVSLVVLLFSVWKSNFITFILIFWFLLACLLHCSFFVFAGLRLVSWISVFSIFLRWLAATSGYWIILAYFPYTRFCSCLVCGLWLGKMHANQNIWKSK